MFPLVRTLRSALIACLLMIALSIGLVRAQDATNAVTLTESQVTWKTLDYQLDANNGMVPDSLNPDKLIDHTFKTYVLENEYLKVTLLPEFGGRILSMIYKPTGHEELYQNPIGVPYGIGEGNFYYDWLMVYGGIFPTFPEPEHGKGWLLPWDFKVVSQTPDAITVAMSLTDDIDFKGRPGKFNTGETGIETTFTVTLKAGRAALDTQITLNNPGDKSVNYEYWTCTTLAPGSTPGDTRATAGAEIIAPVTQIKMPPWWPDTNAQEQPAGTQDVYTFDKLRLFKNWPDMGIAYAYPDMKGANFWGAINHDNQEGLMRIADNTVTPGLKFWTWGFNSTEVDPATQPTVESRPYIEMWAGVSTEFFKRTSLAAKAQVVINETYSPTVGLANVTQASGDTLANFSAADGNADLQVFSLQPGSSAHATVTADGAVIYDMPVTFDPAAASEIKAAVPSGAKTLSYQITDENGTALLTGDLSLGS